MSEVIYLHFTSRPIEDVKDILSELYGDPDHTQDFSTNGHVFTNLCKPKTLSDIDELGRLICDLLPSFVGEKEQSIPSISIDVPMSSLSVDCPSVNFQMLAAIFVMNLSRFFHERWPHFDGFEVFGIEHNNQQSLIVLRPTFHENLEVNASPEYLQDYPPPFSLN